MGAARAVVASPGIPSFVVALLLPFALGAGAAPLVTIACSGTPAVDGPKLRAAAAAGGAIELSGVCALDATWELTVSGTSVSAAAGGASVVGGVALAAGAFSPVTDPAILAQLPAAARGQVQQVDLVAAGIAPRDVAADPWTYPCLSYSGGSATLLYGSYLAGAVELYWGAAAPGAPAVPLTPARFPNADEKYPASWLGIVKKTNGSDDLYFQGDARLAPRTPAWSTQLATDPSSIQLVMFTESLDWATQVTPLMAFDAPDVVRSMYCPEYPSSEQVPGVGGLFYVSNVLAELDAAGEYYVNRTSGMAYVWPPPPPSAAAAAAAPVAWASTLDNLLVVANASGISISGDITFGITRGAALVAENADSLSVTGATFCNAGNMGINVTGGTQATFAAIRVMDTGNGGIYITGGNRTSLAPSGHLVTRATITRYNRHQICYAPGIAFQGVGHSVTDSEIFDAPHQAIWLQGNLHLVSNNTIHDVVQITADSGAIYSGRGEKEKIHKRKKKKK
jgi:hypothetical protein